jgi:hypothetical protein
MGSNICVSNEIPRPKPGSLEGETKGKKKRREEKNDESLSGSMDTESNGTTVENSGTWLTLVDRHLVT